VLYHASVVGPPPHAAAELQVLPQNALVPPPGYRLQANMRRGTGSSLAGTWPPYATIEEAREVAREMLRDDRVLRVTVVEDTLPPRFVEWVNR
jgi:hypothetical protein